MAYVLGFFAADGSMIRTQRGGYYIELKSTDLILIERIQNCIRSNHSISAYERGGNAKTCYRLQIGSRVWFEDLTELGFTQNKSKSMQFPDIPNEYLGDFVRGYFDGDGCVYFKKLAYKDRANKRWVLLTLFTSGSRDFLESYCPSYKVVFASEIQTFPKSNRDPVSNCGRSLAGLKRCPVTAEIEGSNPFGRADHKTAQMGGFVIRYLGSEKLSRFLNKIVIYPKHATKEFRHIALPFSCLDDTVRIFWNALSIKTPFRLVYKRV
jgi:LAGLIDADG-like domain